MEESRFNALMTKWVLSNSNGTSQMQNRMVLVQNGFMKYIKVTVMSKGSTMWKAGDKNELYNQWEQIKDKIALNAP